MILAALAIASATCSSDAPPTYACANAIDGRPETLWHTAWGPDAPPPHYIDLTLEWPSIVERVTVTPRLDGGTNGTLVDFALDLDGVFRREGYCDQAGVCRIAVENLSGHRVRLWFLSTLANGAATAPARWASAAEITVEGRCAPQGTPTPVLGWELLPGQVEGEVPVGLRYYADDAYVGTGWCSYEDVLDQETNEFVRWRWCPLYVPVQRLGDRPVGVVERWSVSAFNEWGESARVPAEGVPVCNGPVREWP